MQAVTIAIHKRLGKQKSNLNVDYLSQALELTSETDTTKEEQKILKGIVTISKNNKTIVVEVTRKFKHPFYEKVIKRSKKYHAHDEKNKFKAGEKVTIIECKPFSKKKTWQVIEK